MTDVKMIEIFRDSHLPEKGWIQSCFNCYTVTSKTFLYKVLKKKDCIYKFCIYNCHECKNKMRKNPVYYLKFSKECKSYIKKKYNF